MAEERNNRRTKALEFYAAGNNCGQSIAMAFADELGMTVEQARRMANALGSGVGGQGEMCGALVAASMVLGARQGLTKAEAYKGIREIGEAFKTTFGGHVRCQELLRENRSQLYRLSSKIDDDPWAELLASRPCASCVARAAELLTD